VAVITGTSRISIQRITVFGYKSSKVTEGTLLRSTETFVWRASGYGRTGYIKWLYPIKWLYRRVILTRLVIWLYRHDWLYTVIFTGYIVIMTKLVI
jgi:hypothetical protein